MPTMLDVAKRAGVALSTVSYAINGTRPVSEETRQRVYEVMDELGYRPHALARGLASKRSRIIALLFPVKERGLGVTELEFVTSAADVARENDYNLILWPFELTDPDELRKMTKQGLVDGVIVMEVLLEDERVDLLREIDFPFTMIGRCADSSNIGFVDIDFDQTMQETIAHLTDLGHTHIGFLNQSQAAFDAGYGPAVRTQQSFEKAVTDAGLSSITCRCSAHPQAGYEAFNQLLNECPELTSMVTVNERALPGVMRAIVDRNWHIPDDFSLIVVVSSARVAETTIPPLTTADAPAAELGRLGAELLIQQLEAQEQSTLQTLLPCQLVVRGSSGPCRRQDRP